VKKEVFLANSQTPKEHPLFSAMRFLGNSIFLKKPYTIQSKEAGAEAIENMVYQD
jgi:hypothetical protein